MARSHPTFNRTTIDQGVSHLRSADSVLAGVIDRVGPFVLKQERNRFGMLVRSIISQQISTAAARSIRMRLELKVGNNGLTAESIGGLSFDEMRSVGLSPQKAGYLADLSEKVNAGDVRLDRIGRCDDEGVIGELTQVKGIGRWTAQMFLLFCLGRLDVFPHDDLGIRSALKRLYGLEDLPDRKTSHLLAAPWRPYASIASWYCWRSGDLHKDEAARSEAKKFPV